MHESALNPHTDFFTQQTFPHTHSAEPRITLLERDEVPAELADIYDRLLLERGAIPNIFKALAQVPALAIGLAAFLKPLMGPGHLSAAYKELVATRVALLNGCDYCISSHRFLAVLAGATPAQIEGLADPEDGPFSPAEKAGFAHADALHSSPHIDDEQYVTTMQHFTQPQMLELTAVAAAFELLPRLVSSLNIPVTPLPESAPAFLRKASDLPTPVA